MAGLVFMLLQLEQYVLNEHLTAFRQHPDERRLKHSVQTGNCYVMRHDATVRT